MTKTYWILMAGLVLLSVAQAQVPAPPPPLPPGAAPPPAPVPVPAAVEPSRCPCCPKACVPECAKKKIEKVSYGMRCLEFCLPKCPGARSHTDCQGCSHNDCPRCGQVRTKKVLVKKVTVIECDTMQCVPR